MRRSHRRSTLKFYCAPIGLKTARTIPKMEILKSKVLTTCGSWKYALSSLRFRLTNSTRGGKISMWVFFSFRPLCGQPFNNNGPRNVTTCTDAIIGSYDYNIGRKLVQIPINHLRKRTQCMYFTVYVITGIIKV